MTASNLTAGKLVDEHAILSMSGAERDFHCPKNLLYKMQPDLEPPTSDAASEGTELHKWSYEGRKLLLGRTGITPEVADAWANRFIQNKNYADLVATNIKRSMYTEELFSKKCVSFKRLLEEKVRYTDDNWGTLDYGLIGTTHKGTTIVYIQDDKWGYREVKAQGNLQLIGYMLAVYTQFRLHSLEAIYLSIYQPRTPGDPLSTWTLTAAELEEWRQKIDMKNEVGLKVLSGEIQPTAKAGPWCKYCWGEGICPTQLEATKENGITLLDKADLAPPSVEMLTLDQMIAIADNEDQILGVIKGVRAHLQRRLENELPVPGWKLVDGQTKSRWLEDEDMVARGLQKLGIEPHRQSLITIGDARKAAGKSKLALVNALTFKPEPGKNLVKDTDSRQKVLGTKGVALLTD